MNEQKYILNCFLTLKERFSGQRVAIYGTGINTKYIIDNLNNKDDIVGIVDSRKAGLNIYGYNVSSIDEISKMADVIIIIARVQLIRMLYYRIKKLEKKGINIFNLEGDNLHYYYKNLAFSYDNNTYWNCSEYELKEQIDKHSTISFDFFDTLLTRAVIHPHDIFDLVQLSFFEYFGKEIQFSLNRIEAENELNIICIPNFTQIYEKLNEKLNLSLSEITWLAEKEMYFEKKLLIPRQCMINILLYAIKKEKTIIILSDMYFSSKFLHELLELNELNLDDVRIIVSNEYQATKESGLLYKVIKEYHNILHIGDNHNADIIKANNAGIDTYYIMSPVDMLLNTPLYKLMSLVQTLEDSLTLGRFVSRILNNPFAFFKGKGKLFIDSLDDLTEFFTPILFYFLRWFIQTVSISNNSIILFQARDGYLMKKLYDIVKNTIMPDLPECVYFLASREALSEKDETKRQNYIKYFNKLGIPKYRNVFLFDIGTKGTSIVKFNEIFNKNKEYIKLICFHTFNITSTFPFPEYIHSFLGDFGFYSLPYVFLKYYELFEIISTPNETQFLYFDNNLNPVFIENEKENLKQWSKISNIQENIIDTLKYSIKIDNKWHLKEYNINLADAILGLISPDSSIIEDDLKKIFVFESPYDNVEQEYCWKRLVG